jgi:hypothetical protein
VKRTLYKVGQSTCNYIFIISKAST